MAELLMSPIPKESLPAKVEATPTGYEFAFYQTYPFPENKMAVLNNGFEGKHLAVPFKPRGGSQRGRDGRQLAIGVDPNDPNRLVMSEDVRPYDGLKDDRRNKTPNAADNVIVFERTGSKQSGFRLFEITGQRFERVERGAEFSVGEDTLTVVGLDNNGDIILYKGKLDYDQEQHFPKVDLPEYSGKKIKFGTPPKPRFPGGFLRRKRSDASPPGLPSAYKSLGTAVDFTPPAVNGGEKPNFRLNEYGELEELPTGKGNPVVGAKTETKRFTPEPQLTKPAWGPLEHIPGVDKPGYPKFKEDPLISLSPREAAKVRGTIRELDYLIRDEKIPDANTKRRVRRLMTIKLPNFDKRLLVLPLVALAIAAATSRSTNPNIPYPELGKGPGAGPALDVPMPELWGPLDPSPAKAVEPVPTPEGLPGANREPKDVEEFRKGVGLGKVKTITADYTVRGDYEDKIKPNAPTDVEGTKLEDVEGYSIIGMVQSDIARVINPDLENDAQKLEAEGKTLPEGDPRLPRTLALFRQKMQEHYKAQGWESADSLYSWLLEDFEARARVGIAASNGKLGKDFTEGALEEGKIKQGKFEKPIINGEEMRRWLGAWLEAGEGGNPDKWRDFQKEVTEQIRQETKTQ